MFVKFGFFAAVTLVLLFVGVVAGVFTYSYGVFPGKHVGDALVGGRALKGVLTGYFALDERYQRKLYGLARSPDTGVVQNDQASVYPGMTVFTSGHDSAAFLMNLDGTMAHEWRLPFREAWPSPDHIPWPVPDDYLYLRKAHVFANGDLLTMYEAPDTTPYGYGMIKLDRDSNLIWKYPATVHHDFDVGPDGRIYALINRIVDKPIPAKKSLRQPVVEDGVVVLDADGKPLKQVFLVDAIARGKYANLLTFIDERRKGGDIFHANGIDRLSGEMASAHPYAKEGQLLISMKRLHALIVLDLETETVVWAALGPWREQHDGDFLANGNLLVFDNEGYLASGGASQVIEFDPITHEIAWSYTGSEEEPLFSKIRSAQQRLPNGNTLITESDQGRLIEVTQQGEIVWEYLNPHRAGPDENYVAVLSWAERVDPASLSFLSDRAQAGKRHQP